jgi:hypothetical protein
MGEIIWAYLQTATKIMLIAIAFKTILGIHFPWETCNCCKKKWRDHK